MKRILSKIALGLGITGILSIGGLLTVTTIVKGPEIHKSFLRSKVGDKVVMIKGNRGGGTGFFVKAPSGKTYILTNSHVCGLADKQGNIGIILSGDGEIIPKRVLRDYEKHDLCLVESFPGIEGLDLAGNVEVGDQIGIIGHPKLYPLVVSKGEYIGNTKITLAYRSGAKHKVMFLEDLMKILSKKLGVDFNGVGDMTFARITAAMMGYTLKTLNSMQLVAYSRPGNSGSPIVNFWGNVVGVLFAGNRYDVMDSYAVPLEDVKEFLRLY